MLIHLLVIGFWLPSSAAGDQIFTELQRISDKASADDAEGRLMRLRTCRGSFIIQCELCEVISIVNASHADRQKESEGSSDFSFHHEFDSTQPANNQYIIDITQSCNGNQTCDFVAPLECGFSHGTTPCCVEIYYTCEQRKGVILSSIYLSNDSAGAVYDVSLQCQSSDLSINSVVLAFNSSGEFHEGGICYKMSTNKKHVAQHCERKGCSHVQVSGATGCGGNSYIHNYGVYIYYTCNSSQLSHCQRRTTTTVAPPITETELEISTKLWVIVAVLLVVAVLVSFIIGYIVGRNRRSNAKIPCERQTRTANKKTSFPATRKTREGEASQIEMEGFGNPNISSMFVQDSEMTPNHYSEIAPSHYSYLKDVIYDEVNHSNNVPKLDNAEVIQSTKAANSIYEELDDLTQNLQQVHNIADQPNNDSNPVCKDEEPTSEVEKPVGTNVDPSKWNQEPPIYTQVNKSNTRLRPAPCPFCPYLH